MTPDQIIAILANVLAVGAMLVAFRVSIEHRITKLESNVAELFRHRDDWNGSDRRVRQGSR